MENITKTLQRLASTFATRDIMIAEEHITWAESCTDAQQKLLENPSFDLIPIKKNGYFTEYLNRKGNDTKNILRDDLVSDSTPILELAGILSQREFCFVLVGNRIAGYVHYSDLNNQLVKIPYYVLLEAVESQIVLRIEGKITDSDIDTILPHRSKRIKEQFRDLSKERADRGYINFMYFREMLVFACHYKVLTLQEKDIKWLNDVRNRVDHADKPLIETQRDAIKLVRTREICLHILEQLNSKV